MKKNTKKTMNLLPYLLLISVIIVSLIFYETFSSKINEISLNDLQTELTNKKVTELNVTPKEGSGVYVITGKLEGYKKTETFELTIPYTDTVISSIYNTAEENNVKVNMNTNPENSAWLAIIFISYQLY